MTIEEAGVSVLVMGCTGIIGVMGEIRQQLLSDGCDMPVLKDAQCAMLLMELLCQDRA